MPQHYSDPKRASDPHALPDVETFRGYRARCRECDVERPLFPDYYGTLHQDSETCAECSHVGLQVFDTDAKWYWWSCLPGCLPNSDPIGPFDTEAEALADAQGGN